MIDVILWNNSLRFDILWVRFIATLEHTYPMVRLILEELGGINR